MGPANFRDCPENHDLDRSERTLSIKINNCYVDTPRCAVSDCHGSVVWLDARHTRT